MSVPQSKLPDVGTTIFTRMSRWRRGARRPQPVPGISRFRCARSPAGGDGPARHGRAQPVRPHGGRDAPARADRGASWRCTAALPRPRHRNHRGAGGHRGHLLRGHGLRARRGRGDRDGPLLRQLRARDRTGGRPGSPRTPGGAAFALDRERVVETALSPRTRMVMINSPHNPTGSTLSRDDLLYLQDAGGATRSARHQRRGLRAPGVRRPLPPQRPGASRGCGRAASCCSPSARPSASPAGRPATAWRRAQLTRGAAQGAPVRAALSRSPRYRWRWRTSCRPSPATPPPLRAFYQRKRDLFCRALDGSRCRALPQRRHLLPAAGLQRAEPRSGYRRVRAVDPAARHCLDTHFGFL